MNDQTRILNIFLRLQSGAQLSKKQLAEEFEIGEKSIQRDFALLGEFVESHPMLGSTLGYNAKNHTRYLAGKSIFNKKDILVLSKILLESRAFNREENKGLIESLLGLVSKEEQAEIRAIIGSELLNYRGIADGQSRIDKIWQLSEWIRREKVVEIDYTSPYMGKQKTYEILPVSLYFDHYYFYLVAYQLKHQVYSTLRIDRISRMKETATPKPDISYGTRYRDGDERNYKADAFSGRKITVRLEVYHGAEFVLDKFPISRVIEEKDGKTMIELESQDTYGLLNWLLGQGPGLKVVSPASMVEKIKQEISKMSQNYL